MLCEAGVPGVPPGLREGRVADGAVLVPVVMESARPVSERLVQPAALPAAGYVVLGSVLVTVVVRVCVVRTFARLSPLVFTLPPPAVLAASLLAVDRHWLRVLGRDGGQGGIEDDFEFSQILNLPLGLEAPGSGSVQEASREQRPDSVFALPEVALGVLV